MKNKYPVVVKWSDEDDAYIAEAPQLRGCLAHGETPSAALQNVLELIPEWLKSAKEHGWPIPEPDDQHLVLQESGS
jgi:predicted RNase H-like HicB family nuclease